MYRLNNFNSNENFLFICGNIESIRRIGKFGKFVIGYDATYNVNMYGYPLWMFTGRDDRGMGFPHIFAISKKKILLRKLKY